MTGINYPKEKFLLGLIIVIMVNFFIAVNIVKAESAPLPTAQDNKTETGQQPVDKAAQGFDNSNKTVEKLRDIEDMRKKNPKLPKYTIIPKTPIKKLPLPISALSRKEKDEVEKIFGVRPVTARSDGGWTTGNSSGRDIKYYDAKGNLIGTQHIRSLHPIGNPDAASTTITWTDKDGNIITIIPPYVPPITLPEPPVKKPPIVIIPPEPPVKEPPIKILPVEIIAPKKIDTNEGSYIAFEVSTKIFDRKLDAVSSAYLNKDLTKDDMTRLGLYLDVEKPLPKGAQFTISYLFEYLRPGEYKVTGRFTWNTVKNQTAGQYKISFIAGFINAKGIRTPPIARTSTLITVRDWRWVGPPIRIHPTPKAEGSIGINKR